MVRKAEIVSVCGVLKDLKNGRTITADLMVVNRSFSAENGFCSSSDVDY
jgi:hypothetical protein